MQTFQDGIAGRTEPPSLVELDHIFRTAGVDLTMQACRKAMEEADLEPVDITHTVAVTCTNQGNPGFDLLVHRQLGLSPTIDGTLLHGVGCAGGLAVMRAASQLALAATVRNRPARILAFACELCTPLARAELAVAESSSPEHVGIAAALFSDAAAAFVLTNDVGRSSKPPIFRLLGTHYEVLIDTMQDISFYVDSNGERLFLVWSWSLTNIVTIAGGLTILSRDVPMIASKAMASSFPKLIEQLPTGLIDGYQRATDCDWALHPGGYAVLESVKRTMALGPGQLHVSEEVYRKYGNSSSPTVLIVLDKLRLTSPSERPVVAASFGPGMSVELAMLQRCL